MSMALEEFFRSVSKRIRFIGQRFLRACSRFAIERAIGNGFVRLIAANP